MIPADEWWAVLAHYNEVILPIQFIWYFVIIILTIWWYISQKNKVEIVLKCCFTISFIWIALVFFLFLGQDLPMHNIQALCFGCIALLFGIDIFQQKMHFIKPKKKGSLILFNFSLILVMLYPLVGLLFDHQYPNMIFCGSFPCPTTALALVFMMWSIQRFTLINWISIILLLIWAIPFPIFIQIPQFGTYEDAIMLSMGIISLIKIVWYLIKQKSKK